MLYSGVFGEVGLRKQLLFYLPDEPINYIDIGAYRGDFFEILQEEKNIAMALLVEPQEDLFQELSKKFGMNPDFILSNRLLSNKKEETIFFVHEMKATSSILPIDKLIEKDLQMKHGKEIRMNSLTLDDLTKDKFPVVHLLKIDVQGAELMVLKGAVETLKRTQKIWIEVSFRPLYSGSPVFNDIYSFMLDHGFVLKTILEGYRNKEKELLQADCLFVKKSG
jgi:FkbM family methyltransferase